MKEIQRNICFRVYEELNALGDGMKMDQLYATAYDMYHGTGPDSLGLAEKFMKGLEMFEGIYEDNFDEMNGKHERVLKKVLHCKDHKVITDEDVRLAGINMTSLTANKFDGKSLIQGRQIWDMGKQVQENGRKILAIVSRSTKYKDGTVASGEGWEDYLKYCRYKMDMLATIEREGKKKRKKDGVLLANVSGAAEEYNCSIEEGNEDDEAQLIKDWEGTATFPGYMSWALWGHIPMPNMDPEYKSQLLAAGDLSGSPNKKTKQKKKNGGGGRTAKRIAKANLQDVARSNVDHVQGGRGLSQRDELLNQHLSRSHQFYETMEQQGGADFVRACINNRLEYLNARLVGVSPLVYAQPDCFTNPDKYKDWVPFQEYTFVRAEIEKLNGELTSLADEMRETMKRKKAEGSAGRTSVTTTGTDIASSCDIPQEVIAIDDDNSNNQPKKKAALSIDNAGLIDNVEAREKRIRQLLQSSSDEDDDE